MSKTENELKLEKVEKVLQGFNICLGYDKEHAYECRLCPFHNGDLDLSCGDILAQDINVLLKELIERIKNDS